MKTERSEVTLRILCTSSALLSQSVKDFAENDIFSKVELFSGLTPKDFQCHDREDCHHLCGSKNISCIEHAISHSHGAAQRKPFASKWLLIVEQDAICTSRAIELFSLLREVEDSYPRTPTAIHLYPEQFGLLRDEEQRFFLQVSQVPDGATGYLINKEAHSQILSDPVPCKEVADWPQSLRKLHWVASRESLIIHPPIIHGRVTSSSTLSRSIRQRSIYSKFRNHFNMKYLRFCIWKRTSVSFGQNWIQVEGLRSRIK